MAKPNEKVVLITGASSGIGRACTVHLARQGYVVFGTTRRSPHDVKADLQQKYGPFDRLEMVRTDVDDNDSVARCVEEAVGRTGRIDGLVNCAGFGIAGSIEDTSIDEARSIFETNLFGTLRVCRAVLPIMRRQRSGTIVNISSIGGRIALPYQGLYSATKFAVEGLTESLRMEVRRFGIRVVLVEPGDFSTGFTDNRNLVRRATEDGVYKASLRKALSVVEADEKGGASPESIGRLVARLLEQRSPRLRRTIGPALQRLAVSLKILLPAALFEWALRKYYGVN